jgi:hypothetical protein
MFFYTRHFVLQKRRMPGTLGANQTAENCHRNRPGAGAARTAGRQHHPTNADGSKVVCCDYNATQSGGMDLLNGGNTRRWTTIDTDFQNMNNTFGCR